jgi:predicted nucleotidyltransferase
MDLPQKRHDILRIEAQYGARNLRVFGSVARGDDREQSDVDLLVDMAPDRSLLDVAGLGQDLEELLDRKVDVSTTASLHSAIRDRLLADSRPL